MLGFLPSSSHAPSTCIHSRPYPRGQEQHLTVQEMWRIAMRRRQTIRAEAAPTWYADVPAPKTNPARKSRSVIVSADLTTEAERAQQPRLAAAALHLCFPSCQNAEEQSRVGGAVVWSRRAALRFQIPPLLFTRVRREQNTGGELGKRI
jgi:hypothetical protein